LSLYEPNATRTRLNGAKTHKIRPKQGSKADELEKTVAWTPRTLKTDKRRKKYMAKTRFRGFFVKKQGFRGLTARNQGLKHNYV
jgi:hypothetical protein